MTNEAAPIERVAGRLGGLLTAHAVGGRERRCVFFRRVDAPSGRIVSATYSTMNGSAIAGLDYIETYGSLAFAPGVTNLTITVPVVGDTIAEPIKEFFLNLANVINGVAVRGRGTATILDGDIAALDHFTVDPMPSVSHPGELLPFTVTAHDSSGAVASSFNDPVALRILSSGP